MDFEQREEQRQLIEMYGEAGLTDLTALEAREAEQAAEKARIDADVKANREKAANEKREQAEARLRAEAHECYFERNENATEADFAEFYPVFRREFMARSAQAMMEADVVGDTLKASLQ